MPSLRSLLTLGAAFGAAVVNGQTVDLACLEGPRAVGWQRAKLYFRAVFELEGTSPLSLPNREFLVASLDGAMQELKAVNALSPEAPDECGLGKLSLQLLTFATVEDPAALVQIFAGLEQLSSPVMTMLLDVPWAATAQAGWPIFGLLGLLNMKKGQLDGILNTLEIDGMADVPGQALQIELATALQAADGNMLMQAGANYLARAEMAGTQGSALAPLTALAAQAAGNPSAQERLGFMQVLQTAFKQVVGSAAELDVALSTNWPVWCLIQLAVEPFAA